MVFQERAELAEVRSSWLQIQGSSGRNHMGELEGRRADFFSEAQMTCDGHMWSPLGLTTSLVIRSKL